MREHELAQRARRRRQALVGRVRHVPVVVTTATAVATVAANAVVVGADNRAARAQLRGDGDLAAIGKPRLNGTGPRRPA